MAKGSKTGGRKAGTPNQVTKELRAALSATIKKEFDTLPQLLAELDKKDRLEVLVKLLPFALPRMEAISFDEVLTIEQGNRPPWMEEVKPPIQWINGSEQPERINIPISTWVNPPEKEEN